MYVYMAWHKKDILEYERILTKNQIQHGFLNSTSFYEFFKFRYVCFLRNKFALKT